MIPAQVIAAWRTNHSWINDRQVEQDLILTRLAVEIAGHAELRDRLVWRGGTCLHKIVMPEPLRYSEDLDYVAFGIEGADFGPILSALREVAGSVGVDVARTKSKHRKLEIRLRFDPARGGPAANIKVEINIDEVESLLALKRRPLRVDTGWWRGETDVLTFHPAEMIGTKFRALAQRSKGRDLNDLELARLHLGLDDEQLAACAAHYLHHEGISSNEFKARLFAHLSDPNFVDDVARFITDPSHTFDPDRLVERWIWWSDEYLDRAAIDVDLANDAHQGLMPLPRRSTPGSVVWCWSPPSSGFARASCSGSVVATSTSKPESCAWSNSANSTAMAVISSVHPRPMPGSGSSPFRQ